MTDLVSLSDIQAQLQAQAETRLLLADAYRIAQQTQATYETDRAAKDATIADQAAQVNALNTLNANQATTITGLTTDKAALTNTVATLTAQVATLTQSNTSEAAEIAGDNATIAALRVQVADLSPDVTVTVGTTPVVSRFEPSVTWADNPPIYGTPAWTAISAKAATLYGAQSTHIFPFGLQEPWSKYNSAPANPAPTSGISLGVNTDGTWQTAPWTLTGALTAMSGATKHMKLYGAPWWMRHKVTPTGLVDCNNTDMYSAVGRVKPSRLNDYLALIDATVTVALKAGVRYFSVWNELKGYLDNGPADMSMNPGSSTVGMGYGYFYKRVTETVDLVAARMGITGVKVGGAYVVQRGRSTSASATTAVSGAWGWLDKGGYDAVEQFMANVIANNLRLDFISVDGADYNKGLATDGSAKPSDWYAADDWVNGQRYHDIHMWLSKWGKPIIWDEYYRYAAKTIYADVAMRDAYDAVLVADFFRTCALDNVQWAFAWTPFSINFNGNRVPGQFDATGQLTPYGNMTAQFRKTFPAGTNVYPLSVSNSSVDGLANDTTMWLYNKTAAPLKVALGVDVYELAAYQLRAVSR